MEMQAGRLRSEFPWKAMEMQAGRLRSPATAPRRTDGRAGTTSLEGTYDDSIVVLYFTTSVLVSSQMSYERSWLRGIISSAR